jgi:hypothetical protein
MVVADILPCTPVSLPEAAEAVRCKVAASGKVRRACLRGKERRAEIIMKVMLRV